MTITELTRGHVSSCTLLEAGDEGTYYIMYHSHILCVSLSTQDQLNHSNAIDQGLCVKIGSTRVE